MTPALSASSHVPADSTADVLRWLRRWSDEGALRHLDAALPAFLAELDPHASPALLMATALLTHMEGHGHTCLPLAALAEPDPRQTPWPDAVRDDLDDLQPHLPPPRLASWLAELSQSPVIRRIGRDDDNGQPLVLTGPEAAPRLYLRRYFQYEQTVAIALHERTGQPAKLDEAQIRPWLQRLFAPAPRDDASPTPSDDATVDWQQLACAIALRGRFSIITGGPGTGKTYTAARLLALLLATHPNPDHLRVALAAPTGKAAARLKQSIDGSLLDLQGRLGEHLPLAALTHRIGTARTLHALLGARPDTRRLRFHAGNPLDVDVVIVDEASMVHLEMMAHLFSALPPTAHLILLGDKDQLASVEAGAVLGDLCRHAAQGRYDADTARFVQATTDITLPAAYRAEGSHAPPIAQHTVMLRRSHRFQGPIGQLALAVNQGAEPRALQRLFQDDTSGALHAHEGATPAQVVSLALQGREGAAGSFRHYLQRLQAGPDATVAEGHAAWARAVLRDFDRCRVLCAVRHGEWGVSGLNQSIVRALTREGWLSPRGTWYAGRPVMVTRNDPAVGVFNGDIGMVLPSPEGSRALRVYFLDGEHLRSVSVSRLANVETAFAMTVHKSQGSEFEHTILVLAASSGAVLTRELVYTGITRARRAFSLVAERPGLLAEGAARPTRRESGLWLR